jgi:hypothetical protein
MEWKIFSDWIIVVDGWLGLGQTAAGCCWGSWGGGRDRGIGGHGWSKYGSGVEREKLRRDPKNRNLWKEYRDLQEIVVKFGQDILARETASFPAFAVSGCIGASSTINTWPTASGYQIGIAIQSQTPTKTYSIGLLGQSNHTFFDTLYQKINPIQYIDWCHIGLDCFHCWSQGLKKLYSCGWHKPTLPLL